MMVITVGLVCVLIGVIIPSLNIGKAKQSICAINLCLVGVCIPMSDIQGRHRGGSDIGL